MNKFVCDVCKKPIERVGDGMLEWLAEAGAQINYLDSPPASLQTNELRLVHIDTKSMTRPSCLRTRTSTANVSSYNLSGFVDADGYLTKVGKDLLMELSQPKPGIEELEARRMIERLRRQIV